MLSGLQGAGAGDGNMVMDMAKYLLQGENSSIMNALNLGAPLGADKTSKYLTTIALAQAMQGGQTANQGFQQMYTNNALSGSMSGINQDDILANQEEQMKNEMYANLLTQGPVGYSSDTLENAQRNSQRFMLRALAGDHIDKDQVLYSMFPEPMATIMRLKKENKAVGDRLFKRLMVQNMGGDEFTTDFIVSGDKDGFKQYLMSKQIETMKDQPGGAFMQTMLYRKMTGQKADPSITDKELLAAGSFAAQLDQNGASVKPNDAYLMFKFLKLQTAKDGKVDPSTILEVALGEDVASIKTEDFEQLFGIEQRDFVCVAHENSIRVPCLVNQATVTEEGCPAHCCFNSISSSGDAQLAGAKVPICYHNLLGKIGAGIARHMINDDNIKKMFGGNMPSLDDLSDAKDWGEAQMPEVLRRLDKDKGEFFGNPTGGQGWWENTYNKADGKFNIFVTPAPQAAKAAEVPVGGPTALPYTAYIPDSGRFGVGREDDQNPLISLNQIVNTELAKVKAQLNSDSYSCKLISKENMVNCYANNYDALSDANPEAACTNKGCCYREQNIFDDKPVCYRSMRAGFCDPYDLNAPVNNAANTWWKANPRRLACGSQQGVTKNDCLLNPQCCYSENPRISGDPVCYHRGGIEQLEVTRSADATMHDAECAAVNVALRENCFDETKKLGKVFNKMATQEQCEMAGCCFSGQQIESSNMLTQMLTGNIDLTGPRCFKKQSLDNINQAPGTSTVQFYKPSTLTKTCDDSSKAAPLWPQLLQNKWTQQANPDGTKKWIYEETATKRPAPREQCDATVDMHECVYNKGCCFEKSSDPRHPWCYKPRYVKTP